MKYVIAIAVLACFAYSVYSQWIPDIETQKCVGEKMKKCNKTCDLDKMIKNNKNGTIDYCCEYSRCAYCVNKTIGVNACGESGKLVLGATVAIMEAAFKMSNCTESERHPSAKCNYHFYTAWFYVVPLLILAVVGGAVFVVIKKRRS